MARRPKDKFISLLHDFSEELAKKTVLKTNFLPNQLTLASFFFIVVAAFFFAWGNYWFNYLALLFVAVSTFLDFSDGVVWRAKNLGTPLGAWLDPALDVTSQLLILFSLTLGIVRLTQSLFWASIGLLALFTLAANNFIGHEFNKAFGFDSYVGLPKFLEKVSGSRKKNRLDMLLLNVVAPSNFFFIFIFTLRYFILIGIIFNILSWTIFFFSLFNFFRAIIMFLIYAATLQETKSKYVVVEILKKLRGK